MDGTRLRLIARAGVSTAVGIVVAGLLGRASDALWWQLLPWALLAGFWAWLLIRNRRGPRDHEARSASRSG